MSNPGTTNLMYWWEMEESSGERYDSYQNELMLEYDGLDTIANRTGKIGMGVDHVQADTNLLSAAIPNGWQSGDWTVGFWTYLDIENQDMTFCGNWEEGAAGNRAWRVDFDNPSDMCTLLLSSNGTSITSSCTSAQLHDSIWYFIIAMHDAGSAAYLWVNDTSGGATSAGCNGTGGAFTACGGWVDSIGGPQNTFDGCMDELFIYNRTLTSAERTWLYNSGSGRSYAEINPPAYTLPNYVIERHACRRERRLRWPGRLRSIPDGEFVLPK